MRSSSCSVGTSRRGRTPPASCRFGGMRGDRRERFAARVEFPVHAASGDYIPGLWAATEGGRADADTSASKEQRPNGSPRFARSHCATACSPSTRRISCRSPAAIRTRTRWRRWRRNVGGWPPRRLAVSGRDSRPVRTARGRRGAKRRRWRDLQAAEARRRPAGGTDSARTSGSSPAAASASNRALDRHRPHAQHPRRPAVAVQSSLLRAAGEAARARAVLERLRNGTVAGGRVSIRLAADGRSTLTAAELEALAVRLPSRRDDA